MMRHDATLTPEMMFSVALEIRDDGVTMTIRDPGLPFNPLDHRHEDQPEIGGHGISLVKGLSDAVAYEHAGGMNCLSVTILEEV